MIERGGCFRLSHMAQLNKIDRDAIQELLPDICFKKELLPDTAPGLCVNNSEVEKYYLAELSSESTFLLSKLRSSIILSHGSDPLNSVSQVEARETPLSSIYIHTFSIAGKT